MVKLYLGRPPYKIEEWIKTHVTSKLSDPLCFTAQEVNSTIQLNGDWSSSGSSNPYGSDPYGGVNTIPKLEYKLEGSINKDWSRYTGQRITLANANDKMYMRATSEGNRTISSQFSSYIFNLTGKIVASGNIQTLLDPTGERTDVPKFCYLFMFADCAALTQAPELPAMTLAESCYARMFYNCTSLTQAPELPAMTLAESCYYYMFYNCTSLTQAPKLPATKLAQNCYTSMFYDCTALTQAPKLPATTLATRCYLGMFYDCTALTQAPELPATALADFCYSGMFDGCTSLTQAPELPAMTLAESCYASMFGNCASLTQAPELPATKLAYNCYYSMFYNCTSLTQAPELPATTLAYNCYTNMFDNCPKFSTVKMKSSMSGKYNETDYGNIQKTVEYVL